MTYPDERSSWRRLLRGAVREPLVHFAVLAGAVFAVHGASADEREPAREAIVIDERFVEELAERTAARTGGDAASIDRGALADSFRREEALYREARRLGLDRGDPIVRRRLVQKMEFLLESQVEVEEPDDAALARYLAEHRARFTRPATVRFDQVFFGGEDAVARAQAALEAHGADAELAALAPRGDAFPLGTTHGPLPASAVRARLGPALAAAVAAAPTARWSAPVISEWGAHVVRVRERTVPQEPRLDAVRAEVRRAWLADAREAELERRVTELVHRWPLERATP